MAGYGREWRELDWLAAYGEDALIKQYTQGFIRQAQQFLDTLSIRPVKEALEDIDACIYPIQEGGVLNALWNYADGIGAGLDIEHAKDSYSSGISRNQ